MRQRSSEGVASADCIHDLRRIAGMAIDLIAGDQQAALGSKGDGHQLHGKLIDDLARAVEQELRRGARLIRKAEQGEHLGHFIRIQLEDGGELERSLDDLGAEEGCAQIYVEDADALRTRFMQEALDGAARRRRTLREGAEANGVCLLRQERASAG